LLITDIRMRDIDGIQLTEAIRATNTRTKIIWITAYGCHSIQINLEKLKVFRCLDKPIRIGEIRQAALEALQIFTE
jgi:DNA-binding NtrC family response regulator